MTRQSTVVWEGEVGGHVYELSSKGEKGVWGTIIVWDPPNELTMTWHPARGEETSQELNIRFTAEGNGTRVDVVHSGWERVGDRIAASAGRLRRGVGVRPGRVRGGRRKGELK